MLQMNFVVLLLLLELAYLFICSESRSFSSMDKDLTTNDHELHQGINDLPEKRDYDLDQPVSYKYEYSVNSPYTGDYKSQQEQRDGDVVRGSYSLIEPDGRRRIVEYTADGVHGFKAAVRYEPATSIIHVPRTYARSEEQASPDLLPTTVEPLEDSTLPTTSVELTPDSATPNHMQLFYFMPQTQPFFQNSLKRDTSSMAAANRQYSPFFRFKSWRIDPSLE